MPKEQTPAFDASKKNMSTKVQPGLLNDAERIALMCKEADYIVCIDGGGSKTLFQVLNSSMEPLELEYKGETNTFVVGGAGNINNVGFPAVGQMLQDTLSELKVGQQKLYLKDIDNKVMICGLAGLVSNADKISNIKEIFTTVGFNADNIHLTSDIDLAKQLIDDHGAILISGTGSICFAKTAGQEKRIGGYGYVLGDEGSGFYIGKLALQAAFEAKFEQGEPFILTEQLCDLFNVAAINEVIKPFYNGTLKPADVAKITPLVFDAAFKHNDPRCKDIIDLCATELAKLVTRAVKDGNYTDYPIYLIGGVFKNENASAFIEMIRSKVSYDKGLKFINISHENVAVQIVLSNYKSKATLKNLIP